MFGLLGVPQQRSPLRRVFEGLICTLCFGYTFQCDRFGEPAPSQGAGLRRQKSRKCGRKWMVIAETLEEGKWLLRQHSNPEHSQHNHSRSIGHLLIPPIRDSPSLSGQRSNRQAAGSEFGPVTYVLSSRSSILSHPLHEKTSITPGLVSTETSWTATLLLQP
jgi:hypothetical protein